MRREDIVAFARRDWRAVAASKMRRWAAKKEGTLHVVRQATPWSVTTSFAERLRDWLVSLLPGR